MTTHDWATGRKRVKWTQVQAAKALGVSQPYLSQLEAGSRVASDALATRAATVYGLPTALPLPKAEDTALADPDTLQKDLAALGYPKFAHISVRKQHNPAGVVLRVVAQHNLDTRLVEALPWVMCRYAVDLDWPWLRDQVKLRNVQNRLGYLVHLAKEVCNRQMSDGNKMDIFSHWEQELEDARLVRENTLCRESMPQAERTWLKKHRPSTAAHWNLLTNLTAEQLPYVDA